MPQSGNMPQKPSEIGEARSARDEMPFSSFFAGLTAHLHITWMCGEQRGLGCPGPLPKSASEGGRAGNSISLPDVRRYSMHSMRSVGFVLAVFASVAVLASLARGGGEQGAPDH